MLTDKIIKLANNTKNYGLQNNFTHKISLKNKKCGDKIIIELEIKDKKIKKMFYETNACIFCQASASLISRSIKNIHIKNINKIILSKKFKFFNAKKYLSRKDCILLPYQAIKRAL